jgi:hypothetical protein
MTRYHAGRPPQPFERPPGIVEQTICADTGGLASDACPRPVRELFLAGTEPTRVDVRYETLRVGNDGACIAASTTPPSQARQITYAVYPEPFREWAIRNGIPQPPTERCPPPASTSPSAFLEPIGSLPAGESVYIHGIARGAFTLEAGRGPDPATWTPIVSADSATAARQNSAHSVLLGIWNTAGLAPGDYTLRLRVVLLDGSVALETRQVMLR